MLKIIHRLKWMDGVLVLGIIFIIIGVGLNFSVSAKQNETEVKVYKNDIQAMPAGRQVDSEVVIDMGGEVMKPGIYKLKKGSRVNDGLIKAGGLTAKADGDWVEKSLNRARVLQDGEKIYIPQKNDQFSNSNFQIKNNNQTINNQQNPVNKFISINTAGVGELDQLSGVGPAIAQRIIDYREKNGGFKSVEEIKLVSGIGDKMFEKIKNEIQL